MVHNEPRRRHEKYEIWHRGGGGFAVAFRVWACELRAALVLPRLPPGILGEGRVVVLDGTRETGFGDVIVDPDGDAYRIEGTLLREIDFPPHRERQQASDGREIYDLDALVEDTRQKVAAVLARVRDQGQ